MTRCLIGHTGFVGGNLARQGRFDALFNSRNIAELAGQSFDEIWCCGVSAVKWQANKDPEADLAGIRPLLDALDTARAARFVLVSTVDVFKTPVGVTEDTAPEREGLHAYGLHRLLVEDFVAARFPELLVVRLPGLFGTGLKKNIIYDFLHDNQVGSIHPDSRFQFYCLDTVHADIVKAQDAGLGLAHFATEPVSVREAAREAFGLAFDNAPPTPPALYDMHTRHAALFGGANPYMARKDAVLAAMRAFVQRERAVMASAGATA